MAAFAGANGLTVLSRNAARRTVVVSGTVARMSAAFAVRLQRYEHSVFRLAAGWGSGWSRVSGS